MPRDPDQKVLYLARKIAGLCVHCGAGLQDDDGLMCVECQEKHDAWRSSNAGRVSQAKSTRRWRALNAAVGLCVECTTPAVAGKRRCLSHLQLAAARTAEYRARASKVAA